MCHSEVHACHKEQATRSSLEEIKILAAVCPKKVCKGGSEDVHEEGCFGVLSTSAGCIFGADL